jgi:hypothetical protein
MALMVAPSLVARGESWQRPQAARDLLLGGARTASRGSVPVGLARRTNRSGAVGVSSSRALLQGFMWQYTAPDMGPDGLPSHVWTTRGT